MSRNELIRVMKNKLSQTVESEVSRGLNGDFE